MQPLNVLNTNTYKSAKKNYMCAPLKGWTCKRDSNRKRLQLLLSSNVTASLDCLASSQLANQSFSILLAKLWQTFAASCAFSRAVRTCKIMFRDRSMYAVCAASTCGAHRTSIRAAVRGTYLVVVVQCRQLTNWQAGWPG